jgi:hypothetical protein
MGAEGAGKGRLADAFPNQEIEGAGAAGQADSREEVAAETAAQVEQGPQETPAAAQLDSSPESQQDSSKEEIDAFEASLGSVNSIDTLGEALSKKAFRFSDTNEIWPGSKIVDLAREVAEGKRTLRDIPADWGELYNTIVRITPGSSERGIVPPPLPTETPAEEKVAVTPPPLPTKKTPPPLPDEEAVTIPVEGEKHSPEEVPVHVEGEAGPVAPSPEEARKALDAIQERIKESPRGKLATAREAYIAAFRADEEGKKAGGFLSKARQALTGKKAPVQEMSPELLAAKAAYDEAMRTYGKSIAAERFAAMGEKTPAAERMAKAQAFREVFLEEYKLRQDAKLEPLAPQEKGRFVKAVNWWAKQKPVTKILTTAALVGFGGTIGAGIAAGLSGASFAVLGASIFEKAFDASKIEQLKNQNLATVWNWLTERQPDTLEAFSKAEAIARQEMAADAARRRMREWKRMAAMVAAGAIGVFTMKGIMGTEVVQNTMNAAASGVSEVAGRAADTLGTAADTVYAAGSSAMERGAEFAQDTITTTGAAAEMAEYAANQALERGKEAVLNTAWDAASGVATVGSTIESGINTAADTVHNVAEIAEQAIHDRVGDVFPGNGVVEGAAQEVATTAPTAAPEIGIPTPDTSMADVDLNLDTLEKPGAGAGSFTAPEGAVSFEDSVMPAEGVVSPETVQTPEIPTLRAEPIPIAQEIPVAEPIPGTEAAVAPETVAMPTLQLTPENASWFEQLHGTTFNATSPLDQAKMSILQRLGEANIMGESAGARIPSPLVTRAIQSVAGSASDAAGWQAVAEKLATPQILEQIQSMQVEAQAGRTPVAVAEASIRALLR